MKMQFAIPAALTAAGPSVRCPASTYLPSPSLRCRHARPPPHTGCGSTDRHSWVCGSQSRLRCCPGACVGVAGAGGSAGGWGGGAGQARAGESFLRVHWIDVPKALRARRVNRWTAPCTG
jgi:hypothetical protein